MPGKLVQFEDGSWGWEDPLDYARNGPPPLIETLNRYLGAAEEEYYRTYANFKEAERYREMRNAVANGWTGTPPLTGTQPAKNAPPLDVYPASVSLRAQREYGLSPEAIDLAKQSDVTIALPYLVNQTYAPHLTQQEAWRLGVGGFAGKPEPFGPGIWVASTFQNTSQPAEVYTHELAHRWYDSVIPRSGQKAFVSEMEKATEPYGPAPDWDSPHFDRWYGANRPANAYRVVSDNINSTDPLYGGRTEWLGTEMFAGMAGTMNEERFKAMPQPIQDAYSGFFQYAPEPERAWYDPRGWR